MEYTEYVTTARGGGQIVVAGAGYAGPQVALLLMADLRHHPGIGLTLVDRHDYHPGAHRVALGCRRHARRRRGADPGARCADSRPPIVRPGGL